MTNISSRVFAAKHGQLRTLALLVVGLLLVVFWPAFGWMGQALIRRNPVGLEQVHMDVPRRWMVELRGRRLVVWKPCLTRLCTLPASTLIIDLQHKALDTAIWNKSAGNILARQGFNFEHRDIPAITGKIECLESIPDRPSMIISSCFNSDLSVVAFFEGAPTDVKGAYQILGTVRR